MPDETPPRVKAILEYAKISDDENTTEKNDEIESKDDGNINTDESDINNEMDQPSAQQSAQNQLSCKCHLFLSRFSFGYCFRFTVSYILFYSYHSTKFRIS